MWKLVDLMADQAFQHRLGRNFDAFVGEAFQVVRWALIVGFAQLLATRFPGLGFRALHLALAALLFGYLASRFLLRPEIRFFPDDAPRWQRLLQSIGNLLICIVAFALVLWGIGAIVDGLADYRGPE